MNGKSRVFAVLNHKDDVFFSVEKSVSPQNPETTNVSTAENTKQEDEIPTSNVKNTKETSDASIKDERTISGVIEVQLQLYESNIYISPALSTKAIELVKKNHFKNAVSIYMQILSIFPSEPTALLHLGTLLHRTQVNVEKEKST